MRVFTQNKRELEHLCHWIRAEIAVSKNDCAEFKENLMKVDKSYSFPVLSTQRKDFSLLPHKALKDGSVVHDNTFNTFINEGYSRVFVCHEVPSSETREKNQTALYLRGKHLTFRRGGEAYDYSFDEKQLREIKALVTFPEKGNFEVTDPNICKKIISICNCPHEKPLEVQKQLNQVYQNYLAR